MKYNERRYSFEEIRPMKISPPSPSPPSLPPVRGQFNQATKLERFYKPEKMRNCLFKMEQFFSIWNDETVDEKHRKAAKALYEHYKRLAMCILAKEFDPKMEVDRVLTPGFIDEMFSGPNPYLM